MMGTNTLFMSSSSSSSLLAPKKRLMMKAFDTDLLKKREKGFLVVQCQGSGEYVIKSSSGGGGGGVVSTSSILKERSAAAANNSLKKAKAGSLVLSPYGGGSTTTTTTTLLDMHDDNDEEVGGIGIVNFLRGKDFFITGATGFLAKVLIEKILRTAPDVGKIYVMIKSKNKEAAMQRLKNEIIDTELFKCLQQSHGKSYQSFMLSKLVPVVGNVCESNLGLDPDLAHLIANEVDVIVNSAANTTFDERYDIAININTRGPCRLMSFAKNCKKLKLFLQVSTAYVNGQRQGRIMEKPFSSGYSIASEVLNSESSMLDVESEIRLVLDLERAFEGTSLETQKMKQLGLQRAKKYGWQDTYVFTKAMGEMVIDNMRGDIPVVIIRPSVIESTFKEPFPGWIEGNRMMDPVIIYYGKGQLTGFLVNPNGVLDVVPADMVVNATLAAMARHGAIKKQEINVYQITSSVVNPLVFEDLSQLVSKHYDSQPCLDSKGNPIRVPPLKLFVSMDDFSSHLWKDSINRYGLAAAANLDTPNGKNLSKKLEIMCKKSVEQAKYLANLYEPYTFYGGRFDNSNSEGLIEIMSEEEKREFGFDVGSIDWNDYITNVHIPGLRKHVMKSRGMS